MRNRNRKKGSIRAAVAVTLFALGAWGLVATGMGRAGAQSASYVVFGYNDLGMHCMNQDFQDLCVLPPANTLHAQVIRRGEEPQIVTSNVTINYSIPGNTTSTNKTNFWQYALPLFGVNLPPNVGLFGFGLAGSMTPTGTGDFYAPGIPLTPLTDTMQNDCYQLAQVEAVLNGQVVATAQPVVPVSWEMRCDLCHRDPTSSRTNSRSRGVTLDILRKHDQLHGTHLLSERPVLCAKCHADPVLGAPGQPGLPNLSSAMHTAHAPRMGMINMENKCYSCHPGPQTACFRDIHFANGLSCTTCHGDMAAVGNPARTPWVDEPKCGSCHHVQGHDYEEPGKLFRDSRGHGGVKCEACHGSPHAITPTVNPRDNVQAIALQGFSGTIRKCTVCHTQTPSEPFFHKIND